MNTKRLVFDPSEYPVFVDQSNENDLYCMTSEEWKRQYEIVQNFEANNPDIPDEVMVEAIPVLKIGEYDSTTDLYDLDMSQKKQFPLNRIKWLWIKGVN